MNSKGLALPLLVLAAAQLMFVLDDTIANIALPSIQREFGVSSPMLPWIINAYVLVFGGLLLFGGRVGDLFGKRGVLRIGLVVFTLASLGGGMGINVEMLVASRALQGLGAALAAPNALALITTTFPVGKARNTAMAVTARQQPALHACGRAAGEERGGARSGRGDAPAAEPDAGSVLFRPVRRRVEGPWVQGQPELDVLIEHRALQPDVRRLEHPGGLYEGQLWNAAYRRYGPKGT
ncbi:MFS transporter [Variovorax sp. DT-64]|uniref:MFS transporter n=1 Tax=Variovorax sp. DT-64 TaxID=3396160 RepID=UPI003F53ED6F